MAELVVVAPLRIEALSVGGRVEVSGAGRAQARAKGVSLAATLADDAAVAIVGVGGGLDPDLVPGQLVVATELRDTDGTVVRALPGAELLATELRRPGLDVVTGPVVSSPTLVRGGRRAALGATGALLADMESAWLAEPLHGFPLAVVRSVADTSTRGMALGGLRAVGSLLRVRPPLERWAAAVGGRDVVLAAPRSFCAGVERAIEIVERALERFGAPVFVRRQIVHNVHVVRDLEAKGAVFVEELDDVPAGATVVLAAHGVSPRVRAAAAERNDLVVIDATCPLVAKVHNEARRFVAQGYHIVLVGHADHEEVVGTLGEAPGHMTVVERPEDVGALGLAADTPLAYLTQTTLATDETAQIIDALRDRFPALVGPERGRHLLRHPEPPGRGPGHGRTMRHHCSWSARQTRPTPLGWSRWPVGRAAQLDLVEDVSALQLAWLDGATTVGLTAGASAPESLVQEVVDALSGLGPITVHEVRTTDETARFTLPAQVR